MTTMPVRKETREHDVYLAIAAFHAVHGYGPSNRDLMELCGLSSTSVAKATVDVLIDRGLIDREAGVARSIRLAQPYPVALCPTCGQPTPHG